MDKSEQVKAECLAKRAFWKTQEGIESLLRQAMVAERDWDNQEGNIVALVQSAIEMKRVLNDVAFYFTTILPSEKVQEIHQEVWSI